jgi:hypothetical protein
VAGIALLLAAIFQIAVYRSILSKRKNQKRLARAEERISQVRRIAEP